jgi:hypothetical protein
LGQSDVVRRFSAIDGMSVTVAVVLVSMGKDVEIWERGDGEVELMGKGDQEGIDASKSLINR